GSRRHGGRRATEIEGLLGRQHPGPLFRTFAEPGGDKQDAVEAVDRHWAAVCPPGTKDALDCGPRPPAALPVVRAADDRADLALADEIPERSALLVRELVDQRELAPRLLQPGEAIADAADKRELVAQGGGPLVHL